MRLLIETADRLAPQLAEELIAVGFEGRPGNLTWLDEQAARGLLDTEHAAGNLASSEINATLRQALEWLPQLEPELNAMPMRVVLCCWKRIAGCDKQPKPAASRSRPNLPLDVLGAYVLMPVPKGLAANL